MSIVLKKFRKVDTFIFDVDGVFTNSDLLVSENGDLLRTMNSRDGFAVKHALNKGYKVIIITGGTSEGVKMRLSKLGVTHIFIGVQDKLTLFHELVSKGSINPETSVYMGDDIPDLEVMQHVVLPACPVDAASEIIEVSEYVSPVQGGSGCVRDIVESVLKTQNKWL